jgi:hypothetical protein
MTFIKAACFPEMFLYKISGHHFMVTHTVILLLLQMLENEKILRCRGQQLHDVHQVS